MTSNHAPRVGRVVGALCAVSALASASGSALAAPTVTVPAAWNQPVTASGGGWWTSSDGGVTIYGKANADYPALANMQAGYCNPYGAQTQLVGASITRVRWHANANDMYAYMRFLTPAGSASTAASSSTAPAPTASPTRPAGRRSSRTGSTRSRSRTCRDLPSRDR